MIAIVEAHYATARDKEIGLLSYRVTLNDQPMTQGRGYINEQPARAFARGFNLAKEMFGGSDSQKCNLCGRTQFDCRQQGDCEGIAGFG